MEEIKKGANSFQLQVMHGLIHISLGFDYQGIDYTNNAPGLEINEKQIQAFPM